MKPRDIKEIEARNQKHINDWKRGQIRAVLIDVNKGGAAAITIKRGDLHSWYDMIGCDLVDIVNRRIAGKPFAFICDDEALCKCDPIMSAINPALNEPMLFGNLIVVSPDVDEDGNIMDMTEADQEYVLDHVGLAERLDGTTQLVLFDVEY